MPDWLQDILKAGLGGLVTLGGALLVWHRQGQDARIRARQIEVEADRVEISGHEAAQHGVATLADVTGVAAALYRGMIEDLNRRVAAQDTRIADLEAGLTACRAREQQLTHRVAALEGRTP